MKCKKLHKTKSQNFKYMGKLFGRFVKNFCFLEYIKKYKCYNRIPRQERLFLVVDTITKPL